MTNSFFDLGLTDEQRFDKYEYILKEQLLISYLSEGAITITETDNMPIHDRKLLLHTLRDISDEKKKKREELKEKRKRSAANGGKHPRHR